MPPEFPRTATAGSPVSEKTPLKLSEKSQRGLQLALQAVEKRVFGPFRAPCTGQIHARSVAQTPFQTVSEVEFSEVQGSKRLIGRGGQHSTRPPNTAERGNHGCVLGSITRCFWRSISFSSSSTASGRSSGSKAFSISSIRPRALVIRAR